MAEQILQQTFCFKKVSYLSQTTYLNMFSYLSQKTGLSIYNVKSCFLGKHVINLSSVEYAHKVVNVKVPFSCSPARAHCVTICLLTYNTYVCSPTQSNKWSCFAADKRLSFLLLTNSDNMVAWVISIEISDNYNSFVLCLLPKTN